MKQYFVYLVECADGTYYTGIATDVGRRVLEHNSSPKGAKYTSARRPVTLKYQEICEGRSAASKREHTIRTLSRKEKGFLIESFTP